MSEEPKSKNITWHHGEVSQQDREKSNGHKAAVICYIGLSGSGKSTLAQAVQTALFERDCQTYVLDGDNVRHGLNNNLGFSPEDRTENIRRIGEVAKLFADAGIITSTAFISPYRADRDEARKISGDMFCEIWVDADLAICEKRDTKGLYKKARAGEIPEFTGISAPYEEPKNAELVVNTGTDSLEDCVEQVLGMLTKRGILS